MNKNQDLNKAEYKGRIVYEDTKDKGRLKILGEYTFVTSKEERKSKDARSRDVLEMRDKH